MKRYCGSVALSALFRHDCGLKPRLYAVNYFRVGNVPFGACVTYERFEYIAPSYQCADHFSALPQFALHLCTYCVECAGFRRQWNAFLMRTNDQATVYDAFDCFIDCAQRGLVIATLTYGL